MSPLPAEEEEVTGRMEMDMEDGFPSFSTDRVRSKMHTRESSVTQRKLDYDAPLLSVRRLADAGEEGRSKVWKHSAELSKEPLRVPGTVPFTWEHAPGRPKQPRESNSPPQSPTSLPQSLSSPYPPSTPSPPSTRPASPSPRSASLPHTPFIRSESSTLYTAPPPPPPPPPPPSVHAPLRIPRRSHPPPPLPPPLPPLHVSASTARVRGKAFLGIDPTEDLLRALRARRDKMDASEAQLAEANFVSESLSTTQAAAHSCEVVDSIIQRFVADHPGASSESDDCKDGGLQQGGGDEEGICDTAAHDAAASAKGPEASAMRHRMWDHTEPSNDIELEEEQASSRVSCNGPTDEEPKMRSQEEYTARAESHGLEQGESNPAVLCVPVAEEVDVSPRQERTQVVLIQKHQSKRRSAATAIHDSCSVDSMRIIKKTLVQIYRKAAGASLRSLAMARRSVAPLRRSSSSLEIFPRGIVPNGTSSKSHQVERESEKISQDKLSQSENQESNLQLFSLSVANTSGMNTQGRELSECISATSCKSESKAIMDISSSPTVDIPVSRDANPELQVVVETTSAPSTSPDVPDLENDNLTRQGSLDSQLSSVQADFFDEPTPYSAHHVYARSLGGDELNDFYDAASRFGSQNSTPAQGYLGRSLSRDWIQSDDFLEAFSTPFESPSFSVSERRYHSSPLINSKASSSRPTSKLSKRVGKSLWLDTREITTGKSLEISSARIRDVFSGELSTTSGPSLNKDDEPLSARRIWASGDQASTSTAQQKRQHERDVLSLHINNSASNTSAVTPVFPSKCQKNRTIASASGLPQQILTEEMKDVGWPLGISGYPPLKSNAKGKAASKTPENRLNSSMFVAPPPLPSTPAGGSWLRKALHLNSLKNNSTRLAGLAVDPAKCPSSPLSNVPNKWEDIIKNSHVMPGNLRFSKELHHHPNDSFSSKNFVS